MMGCEVPTSGLHFDPIMCDNWQVLRTDPREGANAAHDRFAMEQINYLACPNWEGWMAKYIKD